MKQTLLRSISAILTIAKLIWLLYFLIFKWQLIYFLGGVKMGFTTEYFRILCQILLITVITNVGNIIQKFLHLPIAGSIVGLIFFFLLLKLKIIPENWIEKGANFLLTTMVFFFIPSVVGLMDIVTTIDINFIVFFLLVLIGTPCVAVISGYVVEIILSKSNKRGDHN